MVFPILGANTESVPYVIENSLRFTDDTTQWLAHEPTSNGSDMVATFSFWTKRGKLDDNQYIWTSGWDNNNQNFIYINANKLYYYNKASGTGTISYATNRLFRDTAAWYHIVIALNTTQASGSDGIKIYVNGVLETSFSSSTWTQNTTFTHGKAYGSLAHQQIGRRSQYTPSADRYYDGYLADFQYVNGQQLPASSFGKFDNDSGIWVPKKYGGAYGTSGFFLEFKQTGTRANASGKGADTSGNDEHFDDNGCSVFDQTTDTPTNNFSVINGLQQDIANPSTLTEGNCKVEGTNTQYAMPHSTFLVTSGKWYCEMKWTDNGSGDGNMFVGVSGDSQDHIRQGHNIGYHTYGYAYAQWGGKYHNGSSSGGAGSTYAEGVIISIALDLDNNKLYFAKNGSWQNSGDPTSGATGTGAFYTVTDPTSVDDGGYTFGCSDNEGNGDSIVEWNFGNPSFSISSSQADDNGYGNFEYDVPTGYYALCTKNLAEFGG